MASIDERVPFSVATRDFSFNVCFRATLLLLVTVDILICWDKNPINKIYYSAVYDAVYSAVYDHDAVYSSERAPFSQTCDYIGIYITVVPTQVDGGAA